MGTKMMEKTAASAGKKANLSMKQYGMMLALIAVYVIFAFITEGKNLSAMNVNSLIMQNGYVVILAVGMLLCVLTGNVDLGVGSVGVLRRGGRYADCGFWRKYAPGNAGVFGSRRAVRRICRLLCL